jgi:nicotinate-nucleotide adenylyltransferase
MTDRTRAARLGILGGTLDPIHVGHMQAALAAREALRLTHVLVMPARVPPHRERGPAASMFHRFAMAALAAAEHDGFMVSDDELCADGPSYTALTLERLAARGVRPVEMFFITGADAFVEIETWYRYPAVLDLSHFVVISRPGAPARSVVTRLPQIAPRVRPCGLEGLERDRPSVFLVEAPTPDVSSTEIRRRLRANESIAGLVPAAVERHIVRHRLYTEASPADDLR